MNSQNQASARNANHDVSRGIEHVDARNGKVERSREDHDATHLPTRECLNHHELLTLRGKSAWHSYKPLLTHKVNNPEPGRRAITCVFARQLVYVRGNRQAAGGRTSMLVDDGSHCLRRARACPSRQARLTGSEQPRIRVVTLRQAREGGSVSALHHSTLMSLIVISLRTNHACSRHRSSR